MKRLHPSSSGSRRPLRSLFALIVLMVIVSGCSGLLGGGSGDSPSMFSVSGRIFNAIDPDEGIAGATLRLGDDTQISGTDGSYEFSRVPATDPTMTLSVDAAGYKERTLTIVVEANRTFVQDIGLRPAETSPGPDPGTDPGDGKPEPEYAGDVDVSIRLVNASNAATPTEVNERHDGPRGVRPVAALRKTSLADHVPGEWIVEMDSVDPVQPIRLDWTDVDARFERLSDNFYLLVADEADANDVETRLENMPNVVSFGRNRLVSPIALGGPVIPNDEYYFRQWSLPLISAPYAWSLTTGSSNTVVAVLDTGLVRHDDIDESSLVHGRNFAGGQTSLNYADDTNNFSHGTMVAGIIGARSDNGTGIAGLNWDVTMMPVRVMGSNGGGSVRGVGEGIRWAVDNGAHIINMSLAWDGMPNDPGERFVNEQIERAAARGVVMVAGAGNDSGRVTMPAAHPEVIAVGAVDQNKEFTWYSNYGSEIDLVAPGGDEPSDARYREGVLSTDIANGQAYYTYSLGTSFASPHVAGVAALMHSRGITDRDEIREILIDTAEDLGTPGYDVYYGHGLINAYAAVAGVRRTDAVVGVATSDNDVFGPVRPTDGDDTVSALVEGAPSGAQTAFAWIDVNGDGVLDDGDFAAVSPVNVPQDGTARMELTLQIVDTLSAEDKRRLQTIVNR